MPDNLEALPISFSRFGGTCRNCKLQPDCSFKQDMPSLARRSLTLGDFLFSVRETPYFTEGLKSLWDGFAYCTVMCQSPQLVALGKGDPLPVKRTFTVTYYRDYEP
ncbi:hypothetical protein GF362_02020 [Candidatus Dojkabacteria bacterium]|nr:hypothetical protein [Candidatus Dojkabacteria bacterium]